MNNFIFFKRKIILKILIIGLISAPVFFLTNCNKGYVKIHGIIDTIKNCTSPYIVAFYPDAEYGGGGVSFKWRFGDGEESTDRTPVHVYDKPGKYNVILEIVNKKSSDKRSFTLDISSESLPVIPYFDMSTAGRNTWAPAEIIFKNESQHATSFFWQFGDGYNSDIKDPIHTYITPGEYTVTLGGICSGDTTYYPKKINVLPPPKDVYVDKVFVWLPSSYKGANLFCKVFYDIFTVEVSPVAVGISEYPVIFPIHEEVFHFHGDYDNSLLTFEVWEEGNATEPVYIFEIPMHQLPARYYPEVVKWNNGNYNAEVTLAYE